MIHQICCIKLGTRIWYKKNASNTLYTVLFTYWYQNVVEACSDTGTAVVVALLCDMFLTVAVTPQLKIYPISLASQKCFTLRVQVYGQIPTLVWVKGAMVSPSLLLGDWCEGRISSRGEVSNFFHRGVWEKKWKKEEFLRVVEAFLVRIAESYRWCFYIFCPMKCPLQQRRHERYSESLAVKIG